MFDVLPALMGERDAPLVHSSTATAVVLLCVLFCVLHSKCHPYLLLR